MQIVVVGGDAAGMSGASQVRRRRPEWPITVVERGAFTSYAACGIPYFLAGDIATADDLVVVTPQAFREKRHIDVRTGWEAVALDPKARRLVARRPDGGEEALPYDRLLLATGALPVRPEWEGMALSGVFLLRNLADGIALSGRLHAGAGRAVVVGAGYVGLEMAEAFARRGLEVAVVEAAEGVLGGGDPGLTELVAEELAANGVALHLGRRVTGLAGRDGQVAAVATEAGELPCEVALVALGVRPNVALAEAAGVPLGETGAIAVDAEQRTGTPGIWAAGDCCEQLHRVTGRPTWIPLALAANRQGRVAGAVMADAEARFPGVVGSQAFKCFDLAVARTGLTPQQAEAAGYAPERVEATAPSKAHYYPGHAPLHVALWYDRHSRRLLGGRIAGRDPSVAKRVDILAVAITAGLTVDEVGDLDLTYAPPFAPVWDPVLQAANRARR